MGRYLLSLILITVLCGCEKADLSNLHGSFSGTFVYMDPVSSKAPPPSGPVTISFSGNTYQSTGNPNRIPAGGSGTFKILSKEEISFEDRNFWTADFNWNTILKGNYNYIIKGDSLFLTRSENGLSIIEYRLKRNL